jgi:hypothetical protein
VYAAIRHAHLTNIQVLYVILTPELLCELKPADFCTGGTLQGKRVDEEAFTGQLVRVLQKYLFFIIILLFNINIFHESIKYKFCGQSSSPARSPARATTRTCATRCTCLSTSSRTRICGPVWIFFNLFAFFFRFFPYFLIFLEFSSREQLEAIKAAGVDGDCIFVNELCALDKSLYALVKFVEKASVSAKQERGTGKWLNMPIDAQLRIQWQRALREKANTLH